MFRAAKKRWISIITLAVMLVSLMAYFSASAAVDGKKHYYIANANQWNDAAAAISGSNAVIHLTGDINFRKGQKDASGASIAVTPQYFGNFAGTIEGNGHLILNADLSKPLFNTISGTVKDLYIEESVTFTGSSTGILASAINGTVQNVGIRAAVNGGSNYAFAASGSGTITGCFFSGSNVVGLAGGSVNIRYSIGNTTSGAKAYTTSSAISCASIDEAAWTVNQTEQAYFSYGYPYASAVESVIKIGTLRDQIVKVTINGTTSYYDSGDEVALPTIENKTPVRTVGNGIMSGANNAVSTSLIIMNEDTVVEYRDAAAVAKEQGKAVLQTLVDVYESPNLNRAYFTDAGWAKMQTWLSEAKAMIAQNTATGDQFKSKYTAGRSVSTVENVGYVPAKYYSLYMHFPAFQDFSIGDKEDWLALVDAGDMEKLELNQYTNQNYNHFYSIRLHLINDVDMENTPMVALCNGGFFYGTLDGHNYALKNININVESPFGPTGLICHLYNSGIVQNLQIRGGQIKVKGSPLNTVAQVGANYIHEGNRVGGIAGKVEGNALIRKCLVDVQMSIGNAGNTGGIVGDARVAACVDGCIFVGDANTYGIMGYGGNSAYVYNSIYSGNSAAVHYHGNTMTGVDGALEKRVQNINGFTNPLSFSNQENWTDTHKSIYAQFGEEYTCKTFAEAAYKTNQGYVENGSSRGEKDRIYFTLDENGMPTFGDANNQIIKVTVVDRNNVRIGEFYASSNSEVDLTYALGRNYYALVSDAKNAEPESYIRNKVLYIKNAGDLTLRAADAVTGGDAYGNDGAINLMDAQMVLRASVGLNTNLVNALAGDVNFNDELDANDVVLLVRYWMGDHSKYDPANYLSEDDGWFKVASYNVKVLDWDGGVEGGNGYQSDESDHKSMPLADEVAAVIKSVNDAGKIDLLGLQEIGQRRRNSGGISGSSSYCNMTTLADKIGGTWNNAITWATTSAGSYYTTEYGTGVMTPHTISSNKREQYMNQYGAVFEADTTAERRSYGRFVVNVNGTEIIWYNTHLGSVVEQQFEELMVQAKADYAAGKYVVITADFNYRPFGMSKYLNDASGNAMFTMANGGTNGKNFQATTAVTNDCIDNIIISNNLEFYIDDHGSAAHVVSFDDLTAAQKSDCDQSWASDHNLVYAYVRVKK